MEKKFKTNINCAGCVAQATPFLDEACGVGNWDVDTNDSKKLLTVTGENIDEQAIRDAVTAAGYKMETAE